MLYESGDIVGGPDLNEALRWFGRAAEHGDPRGQFALGEHAVDQCIILLYDDNFP